MYCDLSAGTALSCLTPSCGFDHAEYMGCSCVQGEGGVESERKQMERRCVEICRGLGLCVWLPILHVSKLQPCLHVLLPVGSPVEVEALHTFALFLLQRTLKLWWHLVTRKIKPHNQSHTTSAKNGSQLLIRCVVSGKHMCNVHRVCLPTARICASEPLNWPKIFAVYPALHTLTAAPSRYSVGLKCASVSVGKSVF